TEPQQSINYGPRLAARRPRGQSGPGPGDRKPHNPQQRSFIARWGPAIFSMAFASDINFNVEATTIILSHPDCRTELFRSPALSCRQPALRKPVMMSIEPAATAFPSKALASLAVALALPIVLAITVFPTPLYDTRE
ncbi:hypothetical protein CEE89_12590, partial [Lactobacillus crispatus]